jgi:hypothetical protein
MIFFGTLTYIYPPTIITPSRSKRGEINKPDLEALHLYEIRRNPDIGIRELFEKYLPYKYFFMARLSL